MNFFEAQERARKATRWLVCWFILAVSGVIVVMYFLAVISGFFSQGNPDGLYGATDFAELGWWRPDLLLWTALVAGGVILMGSLFKLAQLSAGGKVVARDLGGRPVEPTTTDFSERRLLNVVEEMAIASGLPAPEVWILDEEGGINAFAAGTDPSNAVIGVTRGTMERLTRSELQGVVAHEFSHILNGDMKLNMRLMGWIFGLVMLAMLGRLMLESFRFMRGSRDSKGNGAIVAILLIGLAVWLVGSVGAMFARMIQAGISRQREYLADASAVQFTRDPEGISGALKKIGGFSKHGEIDAAKAAEARHMFFAGSGWLDSVFATHPPLDKRIRAIEPNWSGKMLEGKADRITAAEFAGASSFAGGLERVPHRDRLGSLGESGRLDAEVGHCLREELRKGNVTSFSRDGAKALLFGLLVAQDKQCRERSEAILLKLGFEDLWPEVLGWSDDLAGYSSARKLALVDLSLSWLRKMSRQEAVDFVAASQALIEADGQVDLFEFMLQKVIERHVTIGLGIKDLPKMRYRNLAQLSRQVAVLLHAFGAVGGGEKSMARAKEEYAEHVGTALPSLTAGETGLSEVSKALDEVEAATPLVKGQVLRLCGLVATADDVLEDAEVELLRAVAEAIGAPVPPLVRMRA